MILCYYGLFNAFYKFHSFVFVYRPTHLLQAFDRPEACMHHILGHHQTLKWKKPLTYIYEFHIWIQWCKNGIRPRHERSKIGLYGQWKFCCLIVKSPAKYSTSNE